MYSNYIPTPLKLSRTFSTYGFPSVMAVESYILENSTEPTDQQILDGMPIILPQLDKNGFRFNNGQCRRLLMCKSRYFGEN